MLQDLSEHYEWSDIEQIRIEEKMDEYAEQECIGFFIWYGVKITALIEYMTDIRPRVRSEEIEAKIEEFEGKPIKTLYQLYLKSKQLQ